MHVQYNVTIVHAATTLPTIYHYVDHPDAPSSTQLHRLDGFDSGAESFHCSSASNIVSKMEMASPSSQAGASFGDGVLRSEFTVSSSWLGSCNNSQRAQYQVDEERNDLKNRFGSHGRS